MDADHIAGAVEIVEVHHFDAFDRTRVHSPAFYPHADSGREPGKS